MLKGLRILVVEDVDAIRSLVARLLKSLGCEEIFEAADIDGAWEMINQQELDCILLDYELKGSNGLSLAKRLRKQEDANNHQVPIVVLTGHAEAHVVQNAVQAGTDAYLVKPVMPERLGERILQVLSSRHGDNTGQRATEVAWKSAGGEV